METPDRYMDQLDTLADDVLVRRTLEGSQEAFEQLMKNYMGLVRGIVSSRGPLHEAEDLIQQSWVEAFRSLGKLRDPSKFRSWLVGLCLRVCRHHWQRQASMNLRTTTLSSLTEEDARLASPPTQPETLAADELREAIQQALDRLPERQRIAMTLRYQEDYSYRDIAEALEINHAAVGALLYRAHQILRKDLRPFKEEWT